MHRALFWKEWRQLALVRGGGIILGAVLPPAFAAGAALAARGMLPLGDLKAYSTRDLMYEVLPAVLALGLWPMMALLTAAQAFATDRASGTESFLLERPVPRTSVWWMRLAASLTALLLVVAVTGAFGAAMARFSAAPPAIGWMRWLQWTGAGSAIVVLAYVGVVIAASLIPSPLGALLAGLLMAAIPVILGAELGSTFPFAQAFNAPLGFLWPLPLLPAYVAASWYSQCRGEPAGRGRVLRGVGVVLGTLTALVLLFAVVAGAAVRAEASKGMHLIQAPSGSGHAYVGTPGRDGGGWIFDVATGRRTRFVAPPIGAMAWSPDGSRLAVVTWSGALGSMKREARIDVIEAASGRLLHEIPIPGDRLIHEMGWADTRLVASFFARRGDSHVLSLDAVNTETGAWTTIDVPEDSGWGSLTTPTPGGPVYLQTPVRGNDDTTNRYAGVELRPIDTTAARLGPPLADAEGRPIVFGGWTAVLSPTGRFAFVSTPIETGRHRIVVDTASGREIPTGAIPVTARWLADDRLCWVASSDGVTRLVVQAPGANPVPVREWKGRANIGIEPSPDGRALLVSVLPGDPTPSGTQIARGDSDPALFEAPASGGRIPEEGVFSTDGDRWITLPTFSSKPMDQRYTEWAAPQTLARIANGVVYLEDVGTPGAKRFVLGSEGDLR